MQTHTQNIHSHKSRNALDTQEKKKRITHIVIHSSESESSSLLSSSANFKSSFSNVCMYVQHTLISSCRISSFTVCTLLFKGETFTVFRTRASLNKNTHTHTHSRFTWHLQRFAQKNLTQLGVHEVNTKANP